MPPVAATILWPKMQVRRFSTTVNDNQDILFQGSGTPDGRYLIVKIQGRYDPNYGPSFPEQVALYNPASGAFRVIFSAKDAKHGVTGMVADNHWVIWYERGLPELSNDPSWTLYAYHLDTGTMQTIEHNPGYGVYPSPAIDQGKLIWDNTTGAVTLDRATFEIRLLDLATGATRVLAQRAGNPVISWPWVGWGQVTNADPKQFQGDELFMNLLTGESVTVPVMAVEMVLVGTSLVLTDNTDNNTFFTYIPDIHHPSLANQDVFPTRFTVTNLSFNGRYIGWNSLGTRDLPAVYDVQQRRIIQLPVQYRPNGTEYTFVTPTYIVWGEDPNTDAEETASYQNLHKEPPFIVSIVNLRSL